MHLRIVTLLFLAISLAPALARGNDPVCTQWLRQNKVDPGSKDCELSCATLATDMGTFTCPGQCEELCKPTPSSGIPSKLIYYPGLTPSEKRLIEQFPKDAITVFVQKTRAESASDRNFPTQELNDEGDAFRHFVWAGLLAKELGKTQALKFLNAHEKITDFSPQMRSLWTFLTICLGFMLLKN